MPRKFSLRDEFGDDGLFHHCGRGLEQNAPGIEVFGQRTRYDYIAHAKARKENLTETPDVEDPIGRIEALQCREGPAAVERKVFLFVGSERAGCGAAIYYSLVERCETNWVNPLTYPDHIISNVRNKTMRVPTPGELADLSTAPAGACAF